MVFFFQGAICEPISCIAHGWDRISPVSVGEKILIVGAGIIGNLWAVNLHLQGHRRVTISEPSAPRRQQLKKLSEFLFHSGKYSTLGKSCNLQINFFQVLAMI